MRVMVGREGIEPPQSKTADLQSAELTTCSTYPRKRSSRWAPLVTRRPRRLFICWSRRGTRTLNRRFTKPLLYQLSYGGATAKDTVQRRSPTPPRTRRRLLLRPAATASAAARRVVLALPRRAPEHSSRPSARLRLRPLPGGGEEEDRAGDGGIQRLDLAAHRDPNHKIKPPSDRAGHALALRADDDRQRAAQVRVGVVERRLLVGAHDAQAVAWRSARVPARSSTAARTRCSVAPAEALIAAGLSGAERRVG